MTAVAPQRPSFGFTRHAVDRFIARVRPGLDDREALQALAVAADLAELLPEPTRHGQDVWSVPEPAMRYITKRDLGVHVVVTVVAGATGEAEEAAREVVEAYRRIALHPQIGTPEPTSPAPACCAKHVAAWSTYEVQRLAVEKARLRALAALSQPDDIEARVRERTAALRIEIQRLRAKQRAVDSRNALLLEAADALERQDSIWSRALRDKIRRLAREKGKEDG
jgi:plasmid stabilization system protein ParE